MNNSNALGFEASKDEVRLMKILDGCDDIDEIFLYLLEG